MFEYVPPGKCSGEIFICWASGDIHVCTKDLCRYTVPQHGFPGFNNARRAVCHVCALTRRVFSVNPDQSVSGCGGGDDEGDDLNGGIEAQCAGSGLFGGDGSRVLLEYHSDVECAPARAAVSKRRKLGEALLPLPASLSQQVATTSDDAKTPIESSSKRKRATAASAAVPRQQRPTDATQSTRGKKATAAPRLILYGDDRESRERRIKIYAAVTWKHLPDADTSAVSSWVHAMERIWSVMQTSPGFKPNNSQLQPRLFALVCLNYMRDIGLATKTLCGAKVVRVLPANPYIRTHMADIKQIGEHGFTQAERALMCCMNELSSTDKLRLEFDDKAFKSFYAFFFSLCCVIGTPLICSAIGVYAQKQFRVSFRPHNARQMAPCDCKCHAGCICCTRCSRCMMHQISKISQNFVALVSCTAWSNRQWALHFHYQTCS
jgi:hypothetical protein